MCRKMLRQLVNYKFQAFVVFVVLSFAAFLVMSGRPTGERRQRAGYPTYKGNMSWNAYHRVDDIYAWMEALSRKHRSLASVIDIGTTYEGRPIKVMRIYSGGKFRVPGAIFIEAGAHAREWITPAAATYVIKEMIENYEEHKELVDSFEWYILPVLNADGYEYSHAQDRMWRKTRSRHSQNGHCVGADPNRNFDIHWKEGLKNFPDPCVEIYPGVAPESEKCVRGLVDFIEQLNSNGSQLVGYLTLHAFGQYWLLPYGYKVEKPDNFEDLMDVAFAGSRAIRDFRGTSYTIGTVSEVLYFVTGSSLDWAHEVVKIPFTYLLELSPGEDGKNFLLDPERIPGVGSDLMAGLKGATGVMKRKLLRRNYQHY